MDSDGEPSPDPLRRIRLVAPALAGLPTSANGLKVKTHTLTDGLHSSSLGGACKMRKAASPQSRSTYRADLRPCG